MGLTPDLQWGDWNTHLSRLQDQYFGQFFSSGFLNFFSFERVNREGVPGQKAGLDTILGCRVLRF